MNVKSPKGKLIAIGGAVDKGKDSETENAENPNSSFQEEGILKRMLEEISGTTNRIEIITTASRIPVETGQHYIDAFLRLGNDNVGVLHIQERGDTANKDSARLFDPSRLTRLEIPPVEVNSSHSVDAVA